MFRLFLVLYALFLMAQLQAQTGDLQVTVTNVKNTQGELIFMLFDQADGFPREPQKAAQLGRLSDFSTKSSYTFTAVPYGKYAVAVFRDENDNGKIDTNFLRMPTESVGATNLTGMTRPTFEKCSFQMKEAKQSVELIFINN